MENDLEELIRQHIEEEDDDPTAVQYLSLSIVDWQVENKKLKVIYKLEVMPNIIIIDLRMHLLSAGNNQISEIYGF